jgi:hypothetical protein
MLEGRKPTSWVSTAVMPLVAMGLVMGGMTAAVSDRAAARSGAPSPRSGMEMATDATGNVLLFGGNRPSESMILGDTWTWDGSTWTEREPADSPSPRCCYALGYDPARGQTLLVGGCDRYQCLNDTWMWDGITWSEQHPAHPPSIVSYSPSLAYDAARGELVLTSDSLDSSRLDTWLWDGADWVLQAPTSKPPFSLDGGLSYDAGRHLVTHFGGEFDAFETSFYRDDTWVWNGANWKWVRLPVHPQARSRAGMAFDEVTGQTLLFAGCCRSQGGYFGDTWSWDGSDWQRLNPAHRPVHRERTAVVWDTVRHQIVLFGGDDAPQGYYREFGDTWTWDGSDWHCLAGCE